MPNHRFVAAATRLCTPASLPRARRTESKARPCAAALVAMLVLLAAAPLLEGADCTGPTRTAIGTSGPFFLIYNDLSVALGTDGRMIASVQDYKGMTEGALYAYHCEDAACTSVTKTTISTDPGAGFSNSIAIGGDGLPVIAWAQLDELYLTRCSNHACTTFTTKRVSSMFNGGDASVAIGSDGFPVIAFSWNGVKVAKCNTPRAAARPSLRSTRR